MLFNRCVEQWRLVGREGLFDPKRFAEGCRTLMRERLGFCRTMDVLDCDLPLQKEDKAFGRKYEFRLSVHEEWMACHVILLLSEKEEGTNLTRCSYEDTTDFVVPASWVEALPQVGTFKCCYRSEKEEFRKPRDRSALAERFCGWERGAAS